MTNEEKAKEIARGCFSKRTVDLPVNKLEQIIIKDACLKAMGWKEEQVIEKAIQWLKEHVKEYADVDDYDKVDFSLYTFLEDFEQSMKEE